MASQDLIFRFLGIDAGAGREFDRMAGKASGTSVALARLAKGAVVAGAVIGVASVKAAAGFQTEMAKIQTQADASSAEVTRMSKAMLSLAGPTATAPTELAKGLFHLESAGLRGAKAVEALRVAAEGAKLGGANLEDVTNALNAAISSGIPGVQNMNQAMGYLNATVGEGDMRMQDLADALGTGVLAIVKGFGVTMRDVSAALATFGDNNIRGAEAGTQLRIAVQSMAKPAKQGVEILKALGLQSDSLAKAMQHGGLNEAVGLLKTRMDAAGVSADQVGQVITDAFGRKSSAALTLLIDQWGRFGKKFAESDKQSKNFASSWKGYTKTFGYQFDQMRASVEALAIKLGNVLLPAATALTKFVTNSLLPGITSVAHWIERNKTLVEDLTRAIALSVIGWKAYTLWVGLSEKATKLFGVTAVATSGEVAGAGGIVAALTAATKAGYGWLAVGQKISMAPLYFVGAQSDVRMPSTSKVDAYWKKQYENIAQTAAGVEQLKHAYADQTSEVARSTGATQAGWIAQRNIVEVVLKEHDALLNTVAGWVAFAAQIDLTGQALAAFQNAQGYGTGSNSPFRDPGHPGYGGKVAGDVTAGIKAKAPQMSQALADALAGTGPNSTGSKVASKVSQALQQNMQQFKTDLASAKQSISSVRDSLAGSLSLTGGTDLLGASGASSVNSYLKDRARSLERFAHLFTRLDKMGLDAHLLAQFAQIGPDAIPAMQQLLQGGSKAIAQADRLEHRILKFSTEVGQRLTTDQLGHQLHTDLERLPDKLARKLAEELRKLHIVTDTGKQDTKQGHRVRAH